jgi:hypothetical protein
MTDKMTPHQILNEPVEAFNDFVQAICLPLLDNVQSKFRYYIEII